MEDNRKIILSDYEKDAIKTMTIIANDATIDYNDIFKLICPKESGPDTIKGDVLLDMVIDFIHRNYIAIEDQEFIVDDRLVNQISSGDCNEAIFTLEHYFKRKSNTGHCKECKYFEYDSVTKVDGIPPLIVHEICSRWGNGCKTKEDGYCFMFEQQESEEV